MPEASPLRFFVEAVPKGQEEGQEESYLVKLGTLLHQDKELAITNSTLALSGLGGIGKSSLALQYADVAQKHHLYDFIMWFNAENKEILIQDYRDLLKKWGYAFKEENIVMSLSSALKKERYHHSLLIYDNVPYPKGFTDLFPQGLGHCLMTSRCRRGWSKCLLLDVFSPEESIDYLMRSTGIEDTEENRGLAGKIAAKVGYLPLALEHVGSYLRHMNTDRSTYNFASYLKKFKGERESLEGYDFDSDKSEDEELEFAEAVADKKGKRTVATTWLITMEQLSGKTDPYKCQELMGYCAYLAPSTIPIDLLKTGDKKADEKVEKGLTLLSDYSLLKRTQEAVSVHRLVQWVIRQKQAPEFYLLKKMPEMFPRYVQKNFTVDQSDNEIVEKSFTLCKHMKPLIFFLSDLKNTDTLLLECLGQIFFNIIHLFLNINESMYSDDNDKTIENFSIQLVKDQSMWVKIRDSTIFNPQDMDINFDTLHPSLMTGLGMLYLGQGVARRDGGDTIQAKYWFDKAVAKNYPVAQHYSALLLHEAFSIDSVTLLKKASQQKFALSQFTLGLYYFRKKINTQNYQKAYELFQLAADQGLLEAHYMCGNMLYDANGIENNDEEAVRYWEKGVEHNNPSCQFGLGKAFLRGRGGKAQSKEKAIELFQSAASQDHAESMKMLGALLMEQSSQESNSDKQNELLKEAFEWFKKSAEQELPEGIFQLGLMHYKGYGVKENASKAANLWIKAAYLGHKEALGGLHNLAEDGECSAQFELANIYDRGELVEQDCEQAIQLWILAAQQGHTTSLSCLDHKKNQLSMEMQRGIANIYLQGKVVEENYEEAFKWYLLAAKQGDMISQFNLGNLYKEGEGIAQNYADAFKWFEKSANQGFMEAQVALGIFYQYGYSTAVNEDLAIEWFEKASGQGSGNASYRLSHIFCDSNEDVAAQWLGKAAEQGDPQAREFLQRVALQSIENIFFGAY